MSLSDEDLRVGQQRVAQVFRYLEALNHVRNPAKRHLHNQLWHILLRNLPDHPAIRIAAFANPDKSDASANAKDRSSAPNTTDDYVVKVRRPRLTPCPPPPETLVPWLERGWEEPTIPPNVKRSRNELDQQGRTIIVRFEDDPSRLESLERWRMERDTWVRNEMPAREAMRIFEEFYEIRGQMEREGEKVELVLGDGILSWKRDDGGVYHPVLLQRLELEFDPTVPEFSIVEADSPVELYSALFQGMPDVDGRLMARVRQELEDGKFHPLGKEDTSGLLRSFAAQLSAKGEFLPNGAPHSQNEYPVIGRSPVIFLRPRNLGFAIALQAALEDLSRANAVPSSALLRIVGIEHEVTENADSTSGSSWVDECQPMEVLFCKPANPEQVRIAQRLDRHGSVLVQGPPGTGKSHSIANIIGHLLAQGKSILITSHTTKALKVLRDHVVPQLRPLCVSLLDSDTESRKQLESSVGAIVAKLSQADPRRLEEEAAILHRQRNELVARYRDIAERILNARAGEYRDIIIGGSTFSPSDAARKVHCGIGRHDYIPGPVEFGAPLPLSEAEIADLYRTNSVISVDDEAELRGSLPDVSQLPSAAAFEALADERRELGKQDLSYRTDLWDSLPQTEDLGQIDQLSERLIRVASEIRTAERWQLISMLAGYYGGQHRKAWEGLVTLIEDVWQCASRDQEILLQHHPELSTTFPLDRAESISQEIVAHLEQGGKLSLLVLLTRTQWKSFIRSSRVVSGEPRLPEHFRALQASARVRTLRQQLVARWNSQMVPLGAMGTEASAIAPEAVCRQFAPSIRRTLDWFETEWKPLEAACSMCGLRLAKLLDEQPPDPSDAGELLRLATLLAGPIQSILAARRNLISWNRIEREQEKIQIILGEPLGDERSPIIVDNLRAAVRDYNAIGYRDCITRLTELVETRRHLETRRKLLARLEAVAPGWAIAIRERNGIHGQSHLPESVQDAWIWRQLNDELEFRNRVSLSELEHQSRRTVESIQNITAELIDRRSWAAELRRTEGNHQQKQALVGWLDTIKKIGKGTGIRVPKLKATANRLMSQCRGAVPVWIMPLSRVAENFDPRTTRFDVVVIDEASQSDVMGLIALQLAGKAIVVGDHEQVSPSAVGQDLGIVEHLIDEHLQGVPNSHLYDGQTSIYDLARSSFGGTIRLVEHFRCVPEIIQFSNHLCYEGAIRPLRDGTSVDIKPHVIAHRVKGGSSQGKCNEEEAKEIAALVLAACEQPEYSKKSFGVVSLVGDEQAYRIEALLRRHMPEEQFKSLHKILCGNPAQFQGDERDVMFLSVVDTSDGTVLRMREEPMFKQRFNVAASRAKDQMWVVHSLDPRSHVKPGDLRRRLIEYAEDPRRVIDELDSVESKTESQFEKEVAARLVRAGYRVTPQWPVGYYRIDLVVEGNGKRLAIECDGDKYHPIEKLPDDMARQAVLERLGWTFLRVRGSQFFRDPEAATRSLLSDIFAFGIEPSGREVAPEQSGTRRYELAERVIRRAREIRRDWNGSSVIPTLDGNEAEVGKLPHCRKVFHTSSKRLVLETHSPVLEHQE